jgi:hypothetical protein
METTINMQQLATDLIMPKRPSNRVEPLNGLHTQLCHELSRLEDYCADNDVPNLLLDIRDKMGLIVNKIEELTFKTK